MGPQWHLLRCIARQTRVRGEARVRDSEATVARNLSNEEIAARWVEQHGHEALVILERRWKRPSHRSKGEAPTIEHVTPALPGYLIARFDASKHLASLMWSASKCPWLGIMPIARLGRAVTLRDSDIERLREMDRRGDFDRTRPAHEAYDPNPITVVVGDMVKVPDLPCEVTAEVLSIGDDGVAVINFGLLGAERSRVDARRLAKVG